MRERVNTFDHQEVEWQFDALDVRLVGRWLEGRSHQYSPAVGGLGIRDVGVGRCGGRKLSPRASFVMGGIAYRYEARSRELRDNFSSAYRKIKGKDWKKLKRVLNERRPEDASKE
jgi:hypothetical protein